MSSLYSLYRKGFGLSWKLFIHDFYYVNTCMTQSRNHLKTWKFPMIEIADTHETEIAEYELIKGGGVHLNF